MTFKNKRLAAQRKRIKARIQHRRNDDFDCECESTLSNSSTGWSTSEVLCIILLCSIIFGN